MALIKCPECGKEISDKAEKCPSCGYPITGEKETKVNAEVAENDSSSEKEEREEPSESTDPADEHISDEKGAFVDLENENKEDTPHRKYRLLVVGALVAAGCFICALTVKQSDKRVHIINGSWSYVETSDGREYAGTLKTDSKKDLAAVTEEGKFLILKNGVENEVKETRHTDSSDSLQEKFSSLYEMKSAEDCGIKIDVGETKTDITESDVFNIKYANLETKVTSDSDRPFLLFYHYENADGKTSDAILASTIPYKMMTNTEESFTDTVWDIKEADNTDYQLVIDGVVKFKLKDVESEFGEFSEEMSSYYDAMQPVSISSGESGIAWADVTLDGKDEGLRFCRITDGTGVFHWADSDITDESDAPKVTFEMKYFAPSEYASPDMIDLQEAEKRVPTLREVYDRYGDNSFDTVVLAEDESCLVVDTNPYDHEDMSFSSVWENIVDINKMLGLPDSLTEKMKSTRSMDGRQNESYDNVAVSWTYHPDKGLEVMYEAKDI